MAPSWKHLTMEPSSNTVNPLDLSESQLRELYENEEIDRFLHIFSTYVTEVKTTDIPEASPDTWPYPDLPTTGGKDLGSRSNHVLRNDQSFSERIAQNYVSPILPLRQSEIAPFTLSRVRLTLNRLYIIAQTYLPYFKTLAGLAQWTDFGTSLLACTVFWILWWYNILFPAFILTLPLALLRRGFLPYPNLEDLRQHHQRILQANEFSDQLSGKISPSSTLDIKEIWRLYRLAHAGWKKKSTKSQKPTAGPKVAEATDAIPEDNRIGDDTLKSDDATILDDQEQSDETLELRRHLLYVFTEIANFHERLHNIFIWRNPSASRRYTIALFLIFLVAAIVPTQYLAKGSWFCVGFSFWHITPVLCALSPEDKSRIPPLFVDVPTDAEYAMQLISERAEKGQDMYTPVRTEKRVTQVVDSTDSQLEAASVASANGKLKAFGKFVGNEGLRAAKEAIKAPARAMHPASRTDLHAFMGQRGTSPGVLTLTAERLIFSPLISSQPKVEIDVEAIMGVKKNGVLKGLQVSYLDPETHSQIEERFLWVSSRDELFARLVGFGKKKWKNV